MTTYHIPDLSCGHCKATIEKTIHTLDPAAGIAFDMVARRISIESGVEAVCIEAALAEAGYPAAPV